MVSGLAPEISRPCQTTLPEVGTSSPASRLRSVVFPDPFGPENADDLPLLDLQRDLGHGHEAAETLGEAVDLKKHGANARTARRCRAA